MTKHPLVAEAEHCVRTLFDAVNREDAGAALGALYAPPSWGKTWPELKQAWKALDVVDMEPICEAVVPLTQVDTRTLLGFRVNVKDAAGVVDKMPIVLHATLKEPKWGVLLHHDDSITWHQLKPGTTPAILKMHDSFAWQRKTSPPEPPDAIIREPLVFCAQGKIRRVGRSDALATLPSQGNVNFVIELSGGSIWFGDKTDGSSRVRRIGPDDALTTLDLNLDAACSCDRGTKILGYVRGEKTLFKIDPANPSLTDAEPLSVDSAQAPKRISWPGGIWAPGYVAWPRRRAFRLAKAENGRLHQNAHGITATFHNEGVVIAFDHQGQQQAMFAVPAQYEAALFAARTRWGTLVTLCIEGRESQILHVDDQGKVLGVPKPPDDDTDLWSADQPVVCGDRAFVPGGDALMELELPKNKIVHRWLSTTIQPLVTATGDQFVLAGTNDTWFCAIDQGQFYAQEI